MTIQLRDITFDESDRNLFQVDDARLRADALKHSILPRLHVVLNEALALIKEIYGVEALEDSIVSQSPNFRQRRQNDLKLKYEWAGVGLRKTDNGQVARVCKEKWETGANRSFFV